MLFRSGVVEQSGLKPHHVDSLSTTTAVADLHNTNPVRYFQSLTVVTEPRLVLSSDGTKHMHLKVMESEIPAEVLQTRQYSKKAGGLESTRK